MPDEARLHSIAVCVADGNCSNAMLTFRTIVDLRSRIEGGLVGLLVGDALGVPYEFHAPGNIPRFDRIEYEPPLGYARSHRNVPPGTWSDDGAQALCLLASLIARGRLDLADFGQRLSDWFTQGYMAVDAKVFDVGNQTSAAILDLQAGVAPDRSGPIDAQRNGNGSLMRVLPLALWHCGSDAELVRDAKLQSLPTHGHLRSQLCCALYCVWARRILEAATCPWEDAIETVASHADDLAREEITEHIRPNVDAWGNGTGYVVDCLHSARWAQAANSYEDVVRRAISLGNDTDTTATVAGGIAGIRFGSGGIPQRWRQRLRGQGLLQPLASALLEHRST